MRATVTEEPQALITNTRAQPPGGGGASDADTRSFLVFSPLDPPAGVVLLEPAAVGEAPDLSDAARWNFARGALRYSLEPGRALYAAVAEGAPPVDLDILQGGER